MKYLLTVELSRDELQALYLSLEGRGDEPALKVRLEIKRMLHYTEGLDADA